MTRYQKDNRKYSNRLHHLQAIVLGFFVYEIRLSNIYVYDRRRNIFLIIEAEKHGLKPKPDR